MSELKDRIIETSLKLFEEHGFHRVSVDQIVKQSKTSKGGFYHHFQSKDELLYVIHDYFISYVLKKAQEVKHTHEKPADKLQQIIRSFVSVFDVYQPHISVFYQENHYLHPTYQAAIQEKRDQYKQEIYEVIQEGIDEGEFRSQLPTEIIVMSILGMVNWTYKWYRKEGKYSIDEIADMFIDFILHSLLEDEKKHHESYQHYFFQNIR